MPTISSGLVNSFNSLSTPFSGVVVLSPTEAGCGTAAECLAVSFAAGFPVMAWSRNDHSGSLMPLALPLSINAGRWYLKQVPGVAGVILCDFANIGASMTHAFTINGSSNWSQIFAVATELPVVASSDPTQFIGLWAENQQLRSNLANCAANYAQMAARVAVLEDQNADYVSRVPAVGTAAALIDTLVFKDGGGDC